MKEARLKAILDTLETEYKNIGLSYYPEDLLAPYDLKIIYDYIINLQSQLKAKEEVIKEARKCIEELGHSDWAGYGRSILLEILSKGENK